MSKSQPTQLRAADRQQATRPAFLYHFNYEGTHYYFCNHDVSITVAGGPVARMADPQTFLAAQITHERPEQNLELGNRGIVITLAATDAELRKYFLTVPARSIEVSVFRVNSASMPGPLEYTEDMFLEFTGVAQSLSFDDYTISVECVSLLVQDNGEVPQVHYQKVCNNTLFNPRCTIVKENYALTTVVTALDRSHRTVRVAPTTINVDEPTRSLALNGKYFEGGYAYDAAGNRIGIVSSRVVADSFTEVTLLWWPFTMVVGESITLYPGCDGTQSTCHGTFHNLPNFRGMPSIMSRNLAYDGVYV